MGLKKYSILIFLFLSFNLLAQQNQDSLKLKAWNIHFQQTVITQYHPDFYAPYSDTFSLQPKNEAQTSLTTTFFLGFRLWKGAKLYINPEMAGGSGFSQARGIAGFTNGETFRIGNPKPHAYLARFYIRQIINLSKEKEFLTEGANQLACEQPTSYLSVSFGKYSIADFFDNNKYAHDPRTQFMNWALMSNGAWDYPANTRGYTWGLTMELVKPKWALRAASTLVPKSANGNIMDLNLKYAKSETVEFQKKYSLLKKSGKIRLLGFFTQADMGSYKLAIETAQNSRPDITATRKAGRTKYGWGINIEQEVTNSIGLFARASWNDGRNETWAFTEIDQSGSIGLLFNGSIWKRNEDILGVAFVSNGISKDHRNYLASGGHGFMIGDGKLNYAHETIGELFYNFHLHDQHFWISPGYQFVLNPAYNRDRGPVHVFSLRIHVEF
jgi:high affinity Mn2+ porin